MRLPVGFRRFHRKRFINYQLNRLHSLGYARTSDIERAAARIRTSHDYVREFRTLSDVAEREGRLPNAASYARAAEFFTPASHKAAAYERYIDLFDRAFADDRMTTHEVPYGNSFLPTRRLGAPEGPQLGTVVFFGGFDSIVEEFFAIWQLIADAGFDVIAFDGPGQGGARARYGQVLTHDWERPVGAVLDHFDVDDATLIGFSMGGYWAIRAAAYDRRVRRVVAWPPVYDWLERIPHVVRPGARRMLARRRFMNASVRVRARLSPTLAHVVSQAMYITGSTEPVAVVDFFMGMNAHHLGSERVMQDVALVGGEHDAFQPRRLLQRQAQALTSAHSVTARVFTVEEHADQHCQMGNLPLATSWVTSWIRHHVGR